MSELPARRKGSWKGRLGNLFEWLLKYKFRGLISALLLSSLVLSIDCIEFLEATTEREVLPGLVRRWAEGSPGQVRISNQTLVRNKLRGGFFRFSLETLKDFDRVTVTCVVVSPAEVILSRSYQSFREGFVKGQKVDKEIGVTIPDSYSGVTLRPACKVTRAW